MADRKSEGVDTVSVVIRGVNKKTWATFRKACIDFDVSASDHLKAFIEKVAGEYREFGETNEA